MDLNVAAFVIASLSFLGLCWQIARTESLAPSPSLYIEWGVPVVEPDWGRIRVGVSIRPAFGTAFYGVKIIECPDGPHMDAVLTDVGWRVTEDAPLTCPVRYPLGGSASFVVRVLSVSPIRRRLIARAWLVTVSDDGVDTSGPSPVRRLREERRWWVWFPCAEMLGWVNHRLAWHGLRIRIPLGCWRDGKGSCRAEIPTRAMRSPTWGRPS